MSQGILRVLQPEGWAPAKGYANGIAASGEMIFVAGMIGWNGQCQFETDDFVAQCKQALQNIVATLACAGAGPEHGAHDLVCERQKGICGAWPGTGQGLPRSDG